MFCQEFTDVFYSLFNSSSALHLIAERLASVTADTSFKVFGLTRLRIEPSLPASKANYLSHLQRLFSIFHCIAKRRVYRYATKIFCTLFVLFCCSPITLKPAKSYIYLHYNFSRIIACRGAAYG